MSETLKTCPFCGDSQHLLVDDHLGETYQYVVCEPCNCEGPRADSRQGAIEAWNQRADRCERCDDMSRHFELAEAPEDILHPFLRSIHNPYCVICNNAFGHPWHADVPDNVGRLSEIRKYLKSIGFTLARPRAEPTESIEGWRPIETAAKDGGKEVLLRVKMRAGIPGGLLVGHWMDGGFTVGDDHPAIAGGWYFWNGRMFDKASEPTHWMPLPSPPEPETEVEGA